MYVEENELVESEMSFSSGWSQDKEIGSLELSGVQNESVPKVSNNEFYSAIEAAKMNSAELDM